MSTLVKTRPQDHTEMTEAEVEKFRKILTDFMDELLHQAGYAVSEMARDPQSREAEIIDSASVHIDRNMRLRLHSRKSRLIKKIQDALYRLEDGSFGICETCEEPISLRRLAARPVTTKCLVCKEEEERLEVLMA